MSSDIVERLRGYQRDPEMSDDDLSLCGDAADEIERLHSDLKHARAEIDHHVSGIIAERALADQLFEAMGAVQWAIPSFDPSLTTWNAAVTAYREARRG